MRNAIPELELMRRIDSGSFKNMIDCRSMLLSLEPSTSNLLLGSFPSMVTFLREHTPIRLSEANACNFSVGLPAGELISGASR